MIIQNNFNSKSVDANNDYTIIGKGSNSLFKDDELLRRIATQTVEVFLGSLCISKTVIFT